MRPTLQLAAALLLTGALSHAQVNNPSTQPAPARPDTKQNKKEKRLHEDVEWIWQFTPADKNDTTGRENDLVQDPRFRPMLADNFTAPQTFWGVQGTRFKPINDTALDFLSVPDKVLADENRYVTITGCVVHFCPSRGLLWVDLNPAPKNSTGPDHLMFFAAIQWIQDSKTTNQPDAEYTLWVFPNQLLPAGTPPAALKRSIARWSAQPLAGSGIVQRITHAILVDPDGTPHPLPPTTFGVAPVTPTGNN